MSESQTTYTEQPAAVQTAPQNESLMVFLGIGVVINLVLITAYFVWARKQWKKTDRRDEKE